MEDLGFPWGNINQHQDFEESFIFGSGNIFLNPIQDLRKTDSMICLNPITTQQMGSSQLAPARMDSTNIASSFGGDSQYWCRTLAGNDDKNVITSITKATPTTVTSLESLDCLLSASIMNNHSGVSSGNSVAKEADDGIVSQCSSQKRRINGCYDDDNHPPTSKRSRSDPVRPTSSTISFRQASESDETDSEAIAQMKEMIYRAAAFRPVSFADEEAVERPRRKNVRISSDPQTVAARQRRERISERIRALQKLVPGGNKMDTASMLDEAANYLKFLRSQVKELEQFGQKLEYVSCCTTTNAQSTSQRIQNCISPNVTLGVPFPMQTHFLLPHQQLYPNPPPA